MTPESQMPRWSIPPDCCVLHSLSPNWIRLTYATNQVLCSSGSIWLLWLGHKKHSGFCLALSCIPSSAESQPPCFDNTPASLYRNPSVKRLRFPANSQLWCSGCMSEPLWKWVLCFQSNLQTTIVLPKS